MKALRAIWRELADFMGWSLPSDVVKGYPTSLEEYRERKRINAEQRLESRGRRNTGEPE